MAAQLPIVQSERRELTRRGVLWLGLTCDVRCKFCYDELVASQEKAWMPLGEVTAALDKFRYFYRNGFVDLMGGEPTLHPAAVKIVAHSARIGLRPTIITHGMNLADMKRARAYAEAGIHDFLVSIHGIGDTVAGIHGRGRNNFARQMAALDNLRELGIPFRFNVTMIRDNLSELEAIASLAREGAEESSAEGPITTGAIVGGLAAGGKLLHLHYPDSQGIKADQVNFAADYCSTILGDVAASNAFVVVYDADSRPPLDSLARFEHAIATHSAASVFHQSSTFELRTAGHARHGLAGVGRLVCDGGALRANRFVTGFEIPRLLNRSAGAPRYKRSACSYVYAHVTGHGLCVRLSVMRELPLPARSPLEDMHWSFRLGAHNAPIIAIPSLDVAEVPDRPVDQVRQAARWFFGPGRALQYLRDPTIKSGWRARILAASAIGSAAEWLACAFVPALTLVVVVMSDGVLRGLAIAVGAVYVIQLLVTEGAVGGHDSFGRRLVRVAACPVATVLFGIGGFVGAARLLRGGSGVGKTERR